MPEDITEQLLHAPPAQLATLALEGLSRQGKMMAQVIESVRAQLGESAPGVLPSLPSRIYLVGCGDSYFAGLSARYAFERLTGLPTMALESMEFARYTLLPPHSLAIVVSSGGKVSATLEAGRVAREAGACVIGITSQKAGPLAQELPCLITLPDLPGDPVDQVALMLGNFSFSTLALYLIAVHIGQHRGHLDGAPSVGGGPMNDIQAEISALPNAIERALRSSPAIRDYVERVSDEADFYFLGAGPSFGVALFYQAKFFEQAQRPVYGVELEEFTHEQFFLLRPGIDAQVWFIVPPGRSQQRALEVMAGCAAVGAHVVAVTGASDEQVKAKAEAVFPVEAGSEMFSPLVSVVPGELLGFHAFVRWGSARFSTPTQRRQVARHLAVGEQLHEEVRDDA